MPDGSFSGRAVSGSAALVEWSTGRALDGLVVRRGSIDGVWRLMTVIDDTRAEFALRERAWPEGGSMSSVFRGVGHRIPFARGLSASAVQRAPGGRWFWIRSLSTALSILAARRFSRCSVPALARCVPACFTASEFCFLVAYALKVGCNGYFREREPRQARALKAATGAAWVRSADPPGPVHDSSGSRSSAATRAVLPASGTLCLGLVVLGLINVATLAPLRRLRLATVPRQAQSTVRRRFGPFSCRGQNDQARHLRWQLLPGVSRRPAAHAVSTRPVAQTAHSLASIQFRRIERVFLWAGSSTAVPVLLAFFRALRVGHWLAIALLSFSADAAAEALPI